MAGLRDAVKQHGIIIVVGITISIPTMIWVAFTLQRIKRNYTELHEQADRLEYKIDKIEKNCKVR